MFSKECLIIFGVDSAEKGPFPFAFVCAGQACVGGVCVCICVWRGVGIGRRFRSGSNHAKTWN